MRYLTLILCVAIAALNWLFSDRAQILIESNRPQSGDRTPQSTPEEPFVSQDLVAARLPENKKISRDQSFSQLFSESVPGDKLRAYFSLLQKNNGFSSEELFRPFQADSQATIAEIQSVLRRMPQDSFANEKLGLIEIAGHLKGMEEESAALALELASWQIHTPTSESASELIALPMGSFEVFLNATSDLSMALSGSVQVIGAQESRAARRMLYKLFGAIKPEWMKYLQSELDREGVEIRSAETD